MLVYANFWCEKSFSLSIIKVQSNEGLGPLKRSGVVEKVWGLRSGADSKRSGADTKGLGPLKNTLQRGDSMPSRAPTIKHLLDKAESIIEK